MKILLFGKNGQVGWELQRSLAPLGEITALDVEGVFGLTGDLTDADGLHETVDIVRPDVIVNAAAYTAVDRAEQEIDLAHLANAEAPGVLAEAAARHDAWLVHYSTDYVFDGLGSRPWREEDATGPCNVYGATKLAGEQAIRDAGCRHLILRTSWVYGLHGGNFAKTMLRLAAEREALSVIDDQVGAPTGAELLADVTAHLLLAIKQMPDKGGLYHVAAAGETTWHGYACHVIDTARQLGMPLKVAQDNIRPVPTEAFPTPARRPANSRLDTTKLRETFGLTLPDWKTGVTRMIEEMYGNTT